MDDRRDTLSRERIAREIKEQEREGLRTVTRRVGRAHGTCRGLWALAHGSGPCDRRRPRRRSRCSSMRPATPPWYPASDEARVTAAWTLVRVSTRRARQHLAYRSATSLRLASVSPSI